MKYIELVQELMKLANGVEASGEWNMSGWSKIMDCGGADAIKVGGYPGNTCNAAGWAMTNSDVAARTGAAPYNNGAFWIVNFWDHVLPHPLLPSSHSLVFPNSTWRQPSTSPYEGPYWDEIPATPDVWSPAVAPRPAPQLYPVIDPLTDPRNNPAGLPRGMPRAMPFHMLPYLGSNPDRSPVEQSQHGPAPAAAAGGAKEPPHKREPPQKNEKEKKFAAMPPAARLLSRIFHGITEGKDVFDAAFDAMPKKWQKEHKKDRLHTKAAALWRDIKQLDFAEFLQNLIKNQLEDKFIGTLNKGAGRNKPITRSNSPFGLGYGPAV